MLAYRERIEMTTDAEFFSPLATTIRTLREGAGLSQRALADITKVPEPTIFRLEQDRVTHPQFDMIVPIFRYFGLTPNDAAILLGLWNEPQDKDLTTKLNVVLANLNELIDIADNDLQDEIADNLEVVLGILMRRNKDKLSTNHKPTIARDAINKLPKFLRRRFTTN